MEDEVKKENAPSGAPRVRTYERDVAEFMEREGGTAAKIALAEQEKRIDREQKPPLLPERDFSFPAPYPSGRAGGGVVSIPSPSAERLRVSARVLVLWSIALVFLVGATGIGYWYWSNLPETVAVLPTTPNSSTQKILIADAEKQLNTAQLTRDSFIAAFARERTSALALSSFTLVVPVAARSLTTAEFLSLLNAGVDGTFARALAPEFVLGLRGLPQNRAFLIFKTNYYQTALAGMLQWEDTLFNDAGPLFGQAIGGVQFADKTIKNRDTRILLDSSGKTLLIWGFANKETIIITTDEDTFTQVIGKLVQTE